MKSTCIHEAAHAVVAHYLRRHVDCIKVLGAGDAGTSIYYDPFHETAAKWMDNKAGDSRFELPGNMDEVDSLILANDLVMILVAGYVAEHIHLKTTEDLRIAGSDLLRAEAVSSRFGIDLHQARRDMHQKLISPPFWQAIEHLSTRIMSTENMILDANGVKASLEESGFLVYCDSEHMSCFSDT